MINEGGVDSPEESPMPGEEEVCGEQSNVGCRCFIIADDRMETKGKRSEGSKVGR